MVLRFSTLPYPALEYFFYLPSVAGIAYTPSSVSLRVSRLLAPCQRQRHETVIMSPRMISLSREEAKEKQICDYYREDEGIMPASPSKGVQIPSPESRGLASKKSHWENCERRADGAKQQERASGYGGSDYLRRRILMLENIGYHLCIEHNIVQNYSKISLDTSGLVASELFIA
jgi:hypothetical protein